MVVYIMLTNVCEKGSIIRDRVMSTQIYTEIVDRCSDNRIGFHTNRDQQSADLLNKKENGRRLLLL